MQTTRTYNTVTYACCWGQKPWAATACGWHRGLGEGWAPSAQSTGTQQRTRACQWGAESCASPIIDEALEAEESCGWEAAATGVGPPLGQPAPVCCECIPVLLLELCPLPCPSKATPVSVDFPLQLTTTHLPDLSLPAIALQISDSTPSQRIDTTWTSRQSPSRPSPTKSLARTSPPTPPPPLRHPAWELLELLGEGQPWAAHSRNTAQC